MLNVNDVVRALQSSGAADEAVPLAQVGLATNVLDAGRVARAVERACEEGMVIRVRDSQGAEGLRLTARGQHQAQTLRLSADQSLRSARLEGGPLSGLTARIEYPSPPLYEFTFADPLLEPEDGGDAWISDVESSLKSCQYALRSYAQGDEPAVYAFVER
jgi:hypothetical protein